MTTATMTHNELTKNELNLVNGGSFWDEVTDFVLNPFGGGKKIAKKMADEAKKPVRIRDPYENYIPPFPIQ